MAVLNLRIFDFQRTMGESVVQHILHQNTQTFVTVSRPKAMFGRSVLFPGSVEELELSMNINENHLDSNFDPLNLKIVARCNNEEFDELDEYVFSVRNKERFQYFEEIRFKIRKGDSAHAKVAVKIPPIKEKQLIEGVIEIQLENLNPMYIAISALCEVPQIKCIKDLYKPEQGTSMIKISMDRGMKNKNQIPFQNLSRFDFDVDIGTIANENCANKPYDIITPKVVRSDAGKRFYVVVNLKENKEYSGPFPNRYYIRKVLVLKIKNSSVCYSYPLQIEVHGCKQH